MGKSKLVSVVLAVVLMSVAFAACGSSTDAGAFCADAKKMAAETKNLGTDPASIKKAESLFLTLANDSSGSIKADLELVAADEKKAMSGDVAGIDEKAVDAALKRIDAYGTKTCGNIK